MGANVAALCREYGISRQTGHKWIRRYREAATRDLWSRAGGRSRSPLATGEEIVVSILELKQRHSTYGPKKISLVLARKLGPMAPSGTRWRAFYSGSARSRSGARPCGSGGSTAAARRDEGPNDLWTIDFKGWWRAQNGDSASR